MLNIRPIILIVTFCLIISFLGFSSNIYAVQADDSASIEQTKLYKKYLKLAGDEQFLLKDRKLFIERALGYALQTKNPEQLMFAYSSKAFIESQQGNYKLANQSFNKLQSISDSVGYKTLGDWRRKAYISNVSGLLFKEIGEYDKALEQYYKSLATSDSIKWNNGISTAMNNISVLYDMHGNTPQAIKTLHESWKIAQNDNLYNLMFDISINLMDMFSKEQMFDSAGFYGDRALSLAVKLESPYNSAYTYLGFSNMYLQQKRYILAYNSVLKTYNIANQHGFDELKLESQILLAGIFIKQNELKKADSVLEQGRKTDILLNLAGIHVKYLLRLAEFYNKKDDFKSAYTIYKQAITYRDSLNSSWENIKYSDIEALNQLKFQRQKNEILEKNLSIKKQQIRNQTIIIFISVGFLLIVLLFLAFIYRKRKFDQKTNQLLREQNEKIRKQETIIRQSTEQSMQKELDYKNRQLTSSSLAALKQSESLEKVLQQLRELITTQNVKQGTKKKIEEIIHHLRPHKTETEWEEFRSYFEAVHPSFYINLKKLAPNLSSNELKVCAYLRLGMNTKEIASITFRQVRSVESTRFRIRKKLGLTANDNLAEVLSSL